MIENHRLTLAITSWVMVFVLLAAGLYVKPMYASIAIAAIGLGLPVFCLIWQRPEIGIIGLMLFIAGFVPRAIVEVRLPFGGLDARELILVGLLVILVAKQALTGRIVLPWWPVSGPLLAVLAITAASACYALFVRSANPNYVMSEARDIAYYATFFLAAWSVQTRKQVAFLLVGIFLISDVTAAIMIIQQFLGRDNPVLATMSTGTWGISSVTSESSFGGLRVIPPTHVLMYITAIIAFAMVLYSRAGGWLRLLLIFQFVFLNIGLILTFTRAQWVASTIAMILVLLILPRPDKVQFVRYLVGVLVFALVVYIGIGPQIQADIAGSPYIARLGDRVNSIFTPTQTLQTSSLQWRVYENGQALASIERNPIIGVGLGRAYRDVSVLRSEAERASTRFTRFIHNSYLYIAVKMGIPGLMIVVAFALSLLINSWRAYQKLEDPAFKRFTLAVVTGFIGLLAWANTEPYLVSSGSTASVGLLFGLMAAMLRLDGKEEIIGIPARERVAG